MSGISTKRFPQLGCACAGLRRASRLVTQLYSDEMGREIEPTQFALLSALRQRPGISQAGLCRALGLDKTTMSRSLRLMQHNGWIEVARGDDARERGYQLTPQGAELHTATEPAWRGAQAKLRAALEPAEWEAMSAMLDRIAEAADAANGQ